MFEHSLSKHILPQCLVAYDDSNICLLIPLCRYRFTISYYYTYSHKIIATFSIYEFGIMAYDVAVIRCIVVALERNMSCPWLIEKMQILIWYKHLHCSLIENLTISLYGYRIRYLIESDCEGEDYDGNNYSPQADEARRNFAYHVPHLLTSQLDII